MIPILGDLVGPVLNKLLNFIPDPVAREKAKQEAESNLLEQQNKFMEILAAADKSQNDINLEEAKSDNLFKSGWRPFVGWVCASGFAWATVVQPILVFILAAFHHSMVTPQIQTEVLIQALFGLLGMGGMRMMEKKWGVASK